MNAHATMKAVTLQLDDEIFALEAESVREILDLVPITRVPNAPAFVNGLVNVRGAVVPLADFRVVFRMDRRASDEETRIVVLEFKLGGEPFVVGILADKVRDVTDIDLSCVEEPPKVGMRWPRELVHGIVRQDDAFVMILDAAKVFSILGSQ